MRTNREIITLAGASGTYKDLGTITTLPAGNALFVRFPAGLDIEKVEWIVKCNKDWAYQLFRSPSPSITSPYKITLSTLANTETLFLNGLTYTGATSTTTWSTRTISVAGSDTVDADLLAKAITGGSLVTMASGNAADTVVVTGIDGEALTYTAHATTTTVASREYAINGTDVQDAAALCTCINHKGYFTCSSSIAGDAVVIGDITYTGKAGAENTATHYYSVDTSDDACGTSLAACINADTATHGFTASNSNGVVTLTATTADAPATTITGHATTVVYTPAYGVPGVVATQGAATGEVLIHWETPDGTTPPTVVGGTRRVVTTIGDTYCWAENSSADVNVYWRPAYIDHTGEVVERPITCSGLTGTAAGHAVFTNNLLATLMSDGVEVAHADTAVTVDNSTSAGTILSHTVNGWPEAYLVVTNKDSSNAATVVVKAARIPWED